MKNNRNLWYIVVKVICCVTIKSAFRGGHQANFRFSEFWLLNYIIPSFYTLIPHFGLKMMAGPFSIKINFWNLTPIFNLGNPWFPEKRQILKKFVRKIYLLLKKKGKKIYPLKSQKLQNQASTVSGALFSDHFKGGVWHRFRFS